MKEFMDGTFMLNNPTAVHLYEDYAKNQPIFDYHCHLSVREIYENRPFDDIAQLWLGGDHYKWRMMRGNGIPERLITGEASGHEKFKAYAGALPYAAGNPLYHWTHLELRRYFGIYEILSAKTADTIWEKANSAIRAGGFTPQELIERSNVYALCTTEDPADTLEYHLRLRKEGRVSTKILPAFRPDRALSIEAEDFWEYIGLLSEVSGLPITGYDEMEEALKIRMDVFAAAGCVASDHAFEYVPYAQGDRTEICGIFQAALRGEPLMKREIDQYKTALMTFLGRQYHDRGWAMEVHIGALRSANSRMVRQIGPNTGFDSVADWTAARNLASLLNDMEETDQCPKTILFTLNAADNWVLGTMTGNFMGDEIPGKIQMGAAWWFMDHRDGMEEQMRVMANTASLGRFIGMLTDSRSFLSYPRHEYFRRILCNLIGTWVEQGEYPADEEMLRTIIQGICFENIHRYLGV